MFSKTRVTEPGPRNQGQPAEAETAYTGYETPAAPAARGRSVPSVLSADLSVTGDIKTEGDVQIEGQVQGDIRAHQLTVGETATVRGEILADEVIVHGRVIGRVRGVKVRLTSTARVEGDIVHKTIAIESGAHFEGSVQRADDPLTGGTTPKLAPPKTDFSSAPERNAESA